MRESQSVWFICTGLYAKLCFWLEPHLTWWEKERNTSREWCLEKWTRGIVPGSTVQKIWRQWKDWRLDSGQRGSNMWGLAKNKPMAVSTDFTSSDQPHFSRRHHKIPRGQTISSYITNPGTKKRHKDLQVRNVSPLSSRG